MSPVSEGVLQQSCPPLIPPTREQLHLRTSREIPTLLVLAQIALKHSLSVIDNVTFAVGIPGTALVVSEGSNAY